MDYPSYNTSADSAKPDSTISNPIDQKPVNTQSSNYSKDSREKEIDNMRGFDPASEDDMEDNGKVGINQKKYILNPEVVSIWPTI